MKILNPILASLVCAAAFVSTAFGQGPARVFVSGHGSDANPCSLSRPCRTFQAGVNAVAAGGEVLALDSAGYGGFTVTKSVTVEAPDGVYAGASIPPVPFGLIPFTINVAIADTDTVTLRGLTISGMLSTEGIYGGSAGTLHVEKCDISVVGGTGIASSSTLIVEDTTIRNALVGIFVSGSADRPFHIRRARLERNVSGIAITNRSGTVSESVISGNRATGIGVSSNSNSLPSDVTIEKCFVGGNDVGIAAGISAQTGMGAVTARISDSMIVDNSTGVFASTQTTLVFSRLDNTIEGNQQDFNGLVGSYSAK